jgi:hypothetical protein
MVTTQTSSSQPPLGSRRPECPSGRMNNNFVELILWRRTGEKGMHGKEGSARQRGHARQRGAQRVNAWLGGPISLSQCSFQGPLCIVGPIKIIRHYVLRLERMELKSLYGVLKNHMVLFLKM